MQLMRQKGVHVQLETTFEMELMEIDKIKSLTEFATMNMQMIDMTKSYTKRVERWGN